MEKQEQDQIENMPVLEARWLVICLVVVAPLWIWPFDVSAVFAAFGISILKALGWLIGLTLVVFLGSVTLSAIGKAMLKDASQKPVGPSIGSRAQLRQ